MNRWTEFRRVLKEQPHPDTGPADAFWADFRNRAEGLARERAPSPLRRFVRWEPRFALAAAASLCLLTAVGIRTLHRGSVSADRSDVLSLVVPMPHESVFILRDAATQGAIIWIDLGSNMDEKHRKTPTAQG